MQIKAPEEYGLIVQEMRMDTCGFEDLTEKILFDLKAEDFITFAEIDLEGDSNRDFVNALSNIKRAIENRMDCLLFIFKYHKLIKDWNFPEKIEKLNKLNIIAPRILKKINRIRNLLEHQYQVPKKDDVEDAYDVAILFLAYTKRFIKKFADDIGYISEKESNEEQIGIYVGFNFEKDGVKASIDGTEYYIEATNPRFDQWIRFIIELCY